MTSQSFSGMTYRVHAIRQLTPSTYVVRFDRNAMEFSPGQYVSVGVRGDINMREYSIYSGPGQDFLEILVKEVEHGHVSRKLAKLKPGEELEVDGPFGFFTIDDADRAIRPFLFISTGTGISPFHCFSLAHPDINYRLLHGVRDVGERYEYQSYDPERITTCLSRGALSQGSGEPGRIFPGRVTDFIKANPVAPDTLCYLCGNCDMIYETFDILKSQGVAPEQLFAEVYF